MRLPKTSGGMHHHPGGSPSHTKKTMHFYPGDFDAFWRRRWQR
jgi:hypothetical protein